MPTRPVSLSVYPNPTGDAVAVVLAPLDPSAGNVAMVVLNRQGRLLGSFPKRLGPIDGSQIVWSPGGHQLAYPTYTNTGPALAVANRDGRGIQKLSRPSSPYHLRCLRLVPRLDGPGLPEPNCTPPRSVAIRHSDHREADPGHAHRGIHWPGSAPFSEPIWRLMCFHLARRQGAGGIGRRESGLWVAHDSRIQ